MRKSLAALSLLTMSMTCAPVFAADDAATNTVLLPVRVLAFGVGTVIGVPVSIVKHSISSVGKHDEAMADKMGAKDNAAAKVFVFPVALVTGTAWGFGQGVYDGSKNSVDNCAEHPFSAGSMSLGKE